MTTESTAARIVRELAARPMTRRELADLTGLSAAAIALQIARLRAIRAVDAAGSVESPSGYGRVTKFRVAPDAATVIGVYVAAPYRPHHTAARLDLLALLANTPASVARAAHLTGKSERNTHKVLAGMGDRGLVERQSAPGLASVRFNPTPAGLAMLGEP